MDKVQRTWKNCILLRLESKLNQETISFVRFYSSILSSRLITVRLFHYFEVHIHHLFRSSIVSSRVRRASVRSWKFSFFSNHFHLFLSIIVEFHFTECICPCLKRGRNSLLFPNNLNRLRTIPYDYCSIFRSKIGQRCRFLVVSCAFARPDLTYLNDVSNVSEARSNFGLFRERIISNTCRAKHVFRTRLFGCQKFRACTRSPP